jgi:hypothetical protein
VADGDDGLGVTAARDLPVAFGQLVPLLREGERADWTGAARNHLDPLRVWPEPCSSAESRCPGHIPAHDARWAAVGKTAMLGPISARMTCAEGGRQRGSW